jgi:hypothetical protein
VKFRSLGGRSVGGMITTIDTAVRLYEPGDLEYDDA